MEGTCPVCKGSGKVPLTADELKYSWNKDKTERECSNCGGQKMYGRGTGKVRLNKNGESCTHKYTCSECGDRYEIDSGD